MIYKCLVDNTNALTEKADENQVIDETTWAHNGYGESGAGIISRLTKKPVNKGGQTVIMMDRFSRRPRAYIHRHKLYAEVYPEEKEGWTRNGSFETVFLAMKLKKMVTVKDGKKGIFEKKPTICGDNYFQSDKVMDWLGREGFGGIFTTARDKLPAKVASKYLHKNKTFPNCKVAKVARFCHPIIAVKEVKGKDGINYERIHVSFQSTSSCNISTVNALNDVFNYVEIRERGRGENKRYWVIEMNHARRLYLSLYHAIDVIDHLIKNLRLFYISWKYWHSAKNHGFNWSVKVAYDFYLEVCEGKLNESWKIDKPMDSHTFQTTCALQMIRYDPKNNRYPGDDKFRVVTKMMKKDRVLYGSQVCDYELCKECNIESGITICTLKRETRGVKTRGCGDLTKLCKHFDSMKKIMRRKCAWCGENTYWGCSKCVGDDGKEIPLHNSVEKNCFLMYHNTLNLGMGFVDHKITNKRKSAFKTPSVRELKQNQAYVSSLLKKV